MSELADDVRGIFKLLDRVEQVEMAVDSHGKVILIHKPSCVSSKKGNGQ